MLLHYWKTESHFLITTQTASWGGGGFEVAGRDLTGLSHKAGIA